jgi:NADPH:quinone reductase-like Zn-dependent oxidoreductase/thioesterase domain-containing protein/acyl carrier protein
MKLPQEGPHGPFDLWPNFSVTIDRPGQLDTLQVIPAPRRSPSYGEVQIEVQSVALNFKELLQVLGQAPLPEDGSGFGMECAGIVTEVGPDVVGLELGMEVVAVEGPCLSALATVNAASVVRKPQHLAWEQAAAISVAFLTSYYALHRLGRLRSKESVLIHAATGGIGLAAIQVAQWRGAEIFATAGSPRKREYLQRLGIQHIFDSRTPQFAEQILERTGGRGVDVVLNSLGGELMQKSLSVLAPFGRFLELDRRVVYSNTPLPLGLLEKGGSFFAVQLSPSTPGFHEMLAEGLKLFEEGTFRPLPCQYFSLRRLDEAFNLMARAEHIGKVVINLPKRNAAMSTDSLPPVVLPSAVENREAEAPILAEGLLSSEGLDVFRRVLAGNSVQVIVSTRSLDTRLVEPDERLLRQPDEEAENAFRSVHVRRESGRSYTPPRNELEGTISGVWEKFFRIKLIGIHDNFFDIGGDSLLAVQLSSRLNDAVGVELSPHSLLATPTIAGLAEVITRLKASSADIKTTASQIPDCLIKLKSGDPAQPLFLVHPAGGHVFHYLALVHSLSIPHEIYGVQSEPVNSQKRPMTSLEDMARHYRSQIRKLQPQGPYRIGGASFGGALAYEIAQQLLAEGQQLGILFLIDTADPELLVTDEVEDAELLAYTLRLAFDILDSLDDLRQLLPDEQIHYFLERAKKANKQLPSVSFTEAQQILRPLRDNLKALAHYRPRPIQAQLAYFQAMEMAEGEGGNTVDPLWPKLALEGAIVQSIPGNHITMNFMPHVQVLGDKLRQLLLEGQAPKVSGR